jgi:hypothetical protein
LDMRKGVGELLMRMKVGVANQIEVEWEDSK